MLISRDQVRRFRLHANHLAARLAPGSFATAAFAGLQDSSPRAALMALHARVADVPPDAWEHPSLVQTWAPRGAVFVVPAADLGVFALGIRPRAHTGAAHPRLEHARRGDTVRWDTRTTVVIAGDEPPGDAETARLELARRYLRSLGPGDPERFRSFAAVTPADAEATFAALLPELVEIDVEGRRGSVLRSDLDALVTAQPVPGARLLPAGADPVLAPSAAGLFGAEAAGGHLRVQGVDLPKWCVSGVILVGGEVVGAYGRRGGDFVLVDLKALGRADRAQVEAEAWAAPIPGGVQRVTWRSLLR